MFVLAALIGIIVIVAIASVVVEVKRDGYRRIPQRKFVRSF